MKDLKYRAGIPRPKNLHQTFFFCILYFSFIFFLLILKNSNPRRNPQLFNYIFMNKYTPWCEDPCKDPVCLIPAEDPCMPDDFIYPCKNFP
jgi:hypothetical protein